MAYDFPELELSFIHPPKMGGGTFMHYLHQMHTHNQQNGSAHSIPDVWHPEWEYITLVRHPVPWYRSFWAHRQRTGWSSHRVDYPNMWYWACRVTDEFKKQPFEEFAVNVCKYRPGLLTWFHEYYCVPMPKVTYVHTVDIDVYAALRWGKRVDVMAPHRNVGKPENPSKEYKEKHYPWPDEISDEIKTTILESERVYARKWGFL